MSGGEGLSPQWLITFVIAVTLIEGVLLGLYRRFTGKGVPSSEFLANWVSGLCLMLALRCAVTGTWWVWVALWLMASGAAHWFDLWSRWRR